MARKKRKKNLNKQLKKHRKKLEKQNDLESRLAGVSVINDQEAPEESDLLAAEVSESVVESKEGLDTSTAAADQNLEGVTEVEFQAEGDVEAQTNAKVEEHAAEKEAFDGAKTSVIDTQTSSKEALEEVAESVIPDEASREADLLKSEVKATKDEKEEALESTTAAADENLEGETEVQWQAEGDVEAQTNAAVTDGLTEPSPSETVGEEEDSLESLIASPEAVLSLLKDIPSSDEKATSVVEQEGAPEIKDDFLQPEVETSPKERKEGLESTTAAADENLEGETEVQWQAEGDVEAQTNAAVTDGLTEPSPSETVGEEESKEAAILEKATPVESDIETGENAAVRDDKSAPEETVSDSVIPDQEAPSEDDLLANDIPETKEEAKKGLESTTAAADANLEGETEVQWQAEGDVEAQTVAAVADGKTKPSPEETVGEEESSKTQESAPEEVSAPEETVAESVIPDQEAPVENDLLASDIPETKSEAEKGLESTTAAADANLEGETEVQWQAEGDVEAQTEAAVADGKTKPSPEKTVGEEESSKTQESAPQEVSAPEETVAESVIPDQEAPSEDDLLASDIPETKEEAEKGLESTTAAADANLEGETEVQWQAEGDVEAQTVAAVADGKTKPSPEETVGEEESSKTQESGPQAVSAPEETVAESVIPDKKAPSEDDLLASDIPETKEEAEKGLESTTAAADANLEGETEVQWQAEGDVEAQTEAAVADGATEPSPSETVGEEEDIRKRKPHNHPIEKELPIYLL